MQNHKPNCLAWDCDFEEPAKKTFFRILISVRRRLCLHLFGFGLTFQVPVMVFHKRIFLVYNNLQQTTPRM